MLHQTHTSQSVLVTCSILGCGGTWWYMVCLRGFLKEHRGLGLSTEINLYMHALSQPACCLHTHRLKINCVWYFILEIYSIPLRPACQWFCWDCCSFSYHFIATPAKHSLARKQYLGCACLSVCRHFLDQAFVCVVCIGALQVFVNKAHRRWHRGGEICHKTRRLVILHFLQLCGFTAAPMARSPIHPAPNSLLSPTDGASVLHESIWRVNWVKGK